MISDRHDGNIVDHNALPEYFPTQMHDEAFWSSLGRVVATFGFLEETLAKAIFLFTATTKYNEEVVEKAFIEWLPKLEKTLSDPLGNLIGSYGDAVRDNSEVTIEKLEDLLSDLRKASKLRNVLCHGSWRPPDLKGASTPFFVNRQKKVFETAIDIEFLNQVQRHTCDLASSVINTVTYMGWQFPGSNGPGKVIWD